MYMLIYEYFQTHILRTVANREQVDSVAVRSVSRLRTAEGGIVLQEEGDVFVETLRSWSQAILKSERYAKNCNGLYTRMISPFVMI